MGSHYEISPREREDEQRRHYDEFDAPEEAYWEYLARLAERPHVTRDPWDGRRSKDFGAMSLPRPNNEAPRNEEAA